jgi:hypothetical protein
MNGQVSTGPSGLECQDCKCFVLSIIIIYYIVIYYIMIMYNTIILAINIP